MAKFLRSSNIASNVAARGRAAVGGAKAESAGRSTARSQIRDVASSARQGLRSSRTANVVQAAGRAASGAKTYAGFRAATAVKKAAQRRAGK